MKKVVSILLALFFASSVFAAQGELWGEKNLKQVSTEWFDIIYPESCEESAQVLYDNADSIYESISKMYNSPIPCRITVTLTTVVEMYNAYWTNGYYNRIVLYVSAPIEECNVESDNLLKTFHHELTHAFTYNMKTPFWRWIGKVFGEAVYPGYLNITPGMAEGATVASESYDGEGRLNDEFAKQYVKQAKIEDVFPEFNEVQGSRDIYPSGTYYYFNGAFHEWLQKKYGFEPYSKWWVNCVNAKAITIRRAFKKAYGKSLLKEWELFISEYPVPSIPANPVEAGIAQDFYDKESSEYSILNDQGALPISLSYSEKGLVYIDSRSGKVFFVPAENAGDTKVKPKALFQENLIQSARQSLDGKLIAVTRYDYTKPNYTYIAKVYNTETKRWFNIKETGLQDAGIVCTDGKYYLVALKFHGEDYKIRISELQFDDKNIVSEGEPVYIPYSRLQLPASFTDIQNGKFAYAVKDVMDFYICIADVDGNVEKKFSVPFERMVVRYFSYSQEDNSLYFSWTIPDSMPRLGKFDLNTNRFILDDEDISGGVYYPCKYDDKVIYSGQFYTSNRIFCMDNAVNSAAVPESDDSEENTEEDALVNSYEPYDEGEDDLEAAAESSYEAGSDISLKAEKYRELPFLRKGLLLPFSTAESHAYGLNTTTYSLPIGFMYKTTDPWAGKTYGLSAGYGIQTNSVGLSFDFSSGTGTSLFTYTASASTEFDRYGWKQAEVDLSAASEFPIGHHSVISIIPSAMCFIGRYSATEEEAYEREKQLAKTNSNVLVFAGQRFGEFESVNLTNNIFTSDSITFAYGTVRKCFDNPYSKQGILVGFAPFYMYNATLDGTDVSANDYDIALFARCYIPALIPIHCKEFYTYNLPTKITVCAFGGDSVLGSTTYSYIAPSLAFVAGETILYAQEIQKILPLLSNLYISDCRLSLCGTFGADYSADTANDNMRILKLNKYINELKNNNFVPYGTVSLKYTVSANPTNFGQFASSSMLMNFFVAGNLYICEGGSMYQTSFGFDANF